jgi:hypothetical protein
MAAVSPNSEPAEQVAHLEFRNGSDAPITLIREPVGDQFRLIPGAVLEIVTRGPESETLTIDIGNGQVTLWAERETWIHVFRNGEEVNGL